jgi:hypothetical protein
VKLNWGKRLVVNHPVRVMIQRRIIKWIKSVTRIRRRDRVLEIGCGRGAAPPAPAIFHLSLCP